MTLLPTLALAAILASTLLSAQARELGGQKAQLQAACSADFTTYCPNANPDSDEADECFKKNSANFSSACRKVIDQYKNSLKEK